MEVVDFKKLSIDLSNIKSEYDLHDKMKDLFGFPDFYGVNFNALMIALIALDTQKMA